MAHTRYRAGVEALERGDLTEAIVSLESACRLAPENETYKQALATARERASEIAAEAREGERPPRPISRTRRNVGLVLLALSLGGLVAAVARASQPRPTSTDLASQYPSVAKFTALYKSELGSWHGTVDEQWEKLDFKEQLGRCVTIAAGLPTEGVRLVSIQSSDGFVATCSPGDQ